MTKISSKQNNFMVPLAIIIAGGLIALAIFFGGGDGSSKAVVAPDSPSAQQPTDSTQRINPVTEEDHIRGNPNAPVKIVEYSDFECPFCKKFHPTMQQVMDEYGKDGRVAWVYRHFPLDSLHPVKARLEAVTSECVAEIGGNNSFWQFTDRFFELTPSNNRTDVDTLLPQIVGELGLSQSAVDECVASGKYDQHVQDDIDNAIATGGRGTPWSIVLSKDGSTLPLSGAQPYASVKQLIEIALQ